MLRVAVCDDDKNALGQIETQVRRSPGPFETVGYSSAEKLCGDVENGRLFDIFLLNAAMTFLALLFLSGDPVRKRAAFAAVMTFAVSAVSCLVFCVTGIVLGVNYSSYNHFAVMMHPGFGRRCYLLALTAVFLALWLSLRRVFPKAREWDRRQWITALLGSAAAFSVGWYLRRIAFRKYWLITGCTILAN